MKTILLIAYYFPPSGDPGGQRILKFVKYFPEFEYRSIVLTVTKDADLSTKGFVL